MTEWDYPNTQVVRPDQSAPWLEGEGGSGPEGSTDPQAAGLDGLTKDELIAVASDRGVDVNHTMNKAEIRRAIEDK